jgi:tellurite resistance protein TerC
MGLSLEFEFVSIAVLFVILVADIVFSLKNPKELTNKSALVSVIGYAVLAIIFGGIIWFQFDHNVATQFYSGWLTEYSLSVDNLFVFVMILSSFKVPRKLQKEALGVGILIALVLRAIFIFVGAIVIEQFQWVFYIFGAFLIYTAVHLLVTQEEDDVYEENVIVRFFHKILPLSNEYNGTKMRINDKSTGTKLWTPMLIVFISLGVTDLFFAFDSIPAIFGLTTNPFIVLSANIFALMGLQKLYFLLGNAVGKLKFLPLGIAIVLAFIGVKLIFEALNSSGFDWAPEVGIIPSLSIIVITITLTVLASVLKIKHDKRKVVPKNLDEMSS